MPEPCRVTCQPTIEHHFSARESRARCWRCSSTTEPIPWGADFPPRDLNDRLINAFREEFHMNDKNHTSPGPVHALVGRLESALKARDEAAARVKAELNAVAGTDCSRVALDLYRREYSEANDTFCDLLLINANTIVKALKGATNG